MTDKDIKQLIANLLGIDESQIHLIVKEHEDDSQQCTIEQPASKPSLSQEDAQTIDFVLSQFYHSKEIDDIMNGLVLINNAINTWLDNDDTKNIDSYEVINRLLEDIIDTSPSKLIIKVTI